MKRVTAREVPALGLDPVGFVVYAASAFRSPVRARRSIKVVGVTLGHQLGRGGKFYYNFLS